MYVRKSLHIQHMHTYARIYVHMYICTYVYNTFTSKIKGSFCSLNVIYHNHSSPGVLTVLQLPNVTLSHLRPK